MKTQFKSQAGTQAKSILAASVAAVAAAPGAADAALYQATLTQVLTYSNNGTAGTPGNVSSSTATWTYDDVTGLLTQTGGTFNNRVTTAPTTTLYRHSITGLIIGAGGAATATTFVCTEGNFGGNVGSSICGNYNLGANFTNESTTTWGPGTAAAKTIGGDDINIGPQQTLAGLNGMDDITFDPPPGAGTLVLTNRTCTGPCTTLPAGAYNGGVLWNLTGLTEIVAPGPVDDEAEAEAGQLTQIDVLANDTGYTDPVTVTVTVNPNQGGTATVTGSPGNASAIRIEYTSDPGFDGTETFTYQATDGTLTDTAVVTVTVEDTVPAAITFTTQTGVALSTPVTSSTATISGISTAVPISVANGEYSIDGGAFTSAAGTVQNNQDVNVRHTSAATPATDTVTTLTVGGFSTVQGTFTSTTELADTIPDAFTFPAVTGATASTPYTSDPATISGINTGAAITVTGGEYSIDGGAFTSAAGTVNPGQAVRVRLTSSAAPSTAASATVTIGGVDGTYTVTTGALPDTTPDAFSFAPVTDATTSTVYTSDPATISGIDAAAPISVTGGQYSIDGGAFTAAAGTVTNGQDVAVRLTSSANANTAASATVTIGGVAGVYTVTTGDVAADLTPDQFTFTDQENVPRDIEIISAPVTITGIDAPAPISVTNGQYSIDGGAFTAAAATVTSGQQVRVRHTSAAGYGTVVTTTLTVGGVSDAFSSATARKRGSSSADGLMLGLLGLLGLARGRTGSKRR